VPDPVVVPESESSPHASASTARAPTPRRKRAGV
jgi:hypothetical protein